MRIIFKWESLSFCFKQLFCNCWGLEAYLPGVSLFKSRMTSHNQKVSVCVCVCCVCVCVRVCVCVCVCVCACVCVCVGGGGGGVKRAYVCLFIRKRVSVWVIESVCWSACLCACVHWVSALNGKYKCRNIDNNSMHERQSQFLFRCL